MLPITSSRKFIVLAPAGVCKLSHSKLRLIWRTSTIHVTKINFWTKLIYSAFSCVAALQSHLYAKGLRVVVITKVIQMLYSWVSSLVLYHLKNYLKAPVFTPKWKYFCFSNIVRNSFNMICNSYYHLYWSTLWKYKIVYCMLKMS